MAHPIGNEHRAHQHAKDRVAHIAGKSAGGPKCYASGGAVKASAKAEVVPMRADGGGIAPRSDKAVRRAKGGRAKGTTNVNVIVAPGGDKPPMAGVGMPPAGAAPPMPPKPPMTPMPAPAPSGGPPGLGGMPGGGMPPPPIRSDGGRAYARGGPVSLADKKGVTGIGDRTPIQHSGNKSDSQNIGRGPVITKATGGPIGSEKLSNHVAEKHKPKGEALFSDKGPMGPKLPSGSGSGGGRKFLAHQFNPKGHQPWNKDYKT